jgi:hypothetical protein
VARQPDNIFSAFGAALVSASAKDIEAVLAPDAVLEDAFLQTPHEGSTIIGPLLAAQLGCTPVRELIDSYRDATLGAFHLKQHIEGHYLESLVVARLNASATLIQEIRYFTRRFAVLTLWRDACKVALRDHLRDSVWNLPAIKPDDGVLQPVKRSIPLAENIVFFSPVLLKPTIGAEMTGYVLQRAASVYGVPQFSPEAIEKNDYDKVVFWKGIVGNEHPVYSAQIVKWNEKREFEFIKTFSRPYEVVLGFVVAMRERLRGHSTETYFDLQPGADAA